MPNTQLDTSTVQSFAATLLVKPGGQFLIFPDIRLQWRPKRQGVTTAESIAPVGATPKLLKKLRHQGTGVATTFTLSGDAKRRSVEAHAKEQRPEEDSVTHVLVRLVIRDKKRPLARVLVHNGTAQVFEEIASRELFAAPIGSRLRFELADGTAAELMLDRQTSCRKVSRSISDDWTVKVSAPPPRFTAEQHAERGRGKSLEQPGSRRGRRFRRTDPRKKKAGVATCR